jgi:ADP-ribose pyrophosphatase
LQGQTPSDASDKKKQLSWKTISRELIADCEGFLVHKTNAESTCEKQVRSGFHTITCSNWVNVIAITGDAQVVMAEQFRHGIAELTLEIPGGCIDESDLDPLSAAKRELLEETGYSSEKWTMLGKSHPNPALLNNVCYTFLAEDAKKVEEAKFDGTGTENIHCRLLALNSIDAQITDGTISHSLVLAAFHLLSIKRSKTRTF